jgi:hypothetical protein
VLSSVFLGGDFYQPAKMVTDKAYGRTYNIKPLHTDAELMMMATKDRAAAIEFEKKHRKPQLAVEYSFCQQVTNFIRELICSIIGNFSCCYHSSIDSFCSMYTILETS